MVAPIAKRQRISVVMDHPAPSSALTQPNPAEGLALTHQPRLSRRSAVEPFIVMDVMAAANLREARGASVLHMEIGQPGSPTPQRVLNAAAAALATGRIGYTEALGLPSLRQRIARHYAEAYGVSVPAERVCVTTGSSGAFILSFLALFDPGDRVAIAAPGYPAYRNILQAFGIETVEIPVHAEDRWVLTRSQIEKAHAEGGLRGVLVMSPANPSGTMMLPGALADLAACCRDRGIWLVSDEIYHGLTYEEPAQTALAFDDDAVIINSFSKYYCMTGWRIGWMVLPARLVRAVERLAQSLFISVPMLSQVAAEEAFEAREELEAIKAGYARNRAMLLDQLPSVGLPEILPVDGAFYVYADVGRYTNDSAAFCGRILAETGIALTPGLDFDRERGHRTVRLSFAGTEADCRETLVRLKSFLAG